MRNALLIENKSLSSSQLWLSFGLGSIELIMFVALN